jgi:hypothetical protein
LATGWAFGCPVPKRFLGRDHVLRQTFDDKPKSTELRRNPSPRIAAKHTPTRILAIERLRHFVAAYRKARDAWRTGNTDAVFPQGTYALRRLADVRCADAGTA